MKWEENSRDMLRHDFKTRWKWMNIVATETRGCRPICMRTFTPHSVHKACVLLIFMSKDTPDFPARCHVFCSPLDAPNTSSRWYFGSTHPSKAVAHLFRSLKCDCASYHLWLRQFLWLLPKCTRALSCRMDRLPLHAWSSNNIWDACHICT